MADVVIMPRLSLNEETSLLSEWYVEEGDAVKEGDKLFSIETDKSTLDVDSKFQGTILKKYYGNFEVVNVLSPVCVVGQEGEELPDIDIPEQRFLVNGEVKEVKEPCFHQKVKEEISSAVKTAAEDTDSIKVFTPRAKKLAQKNGVTDTLLFEASGANHRIMEEDIIRYMEPGQVKAEVSSEPITVGLSKIRKVIALNMMGSLKSTAQLTINSVYNASAVMALRKKFKAGAAGIKMQEVTIGDLVLLAASRTLSELTYMNALSVNDDKVIEFRTVNLGCAVDTERGLMVPTIYKAEKKSLLEISKEVKELASECRSGGIAPDKLKNGTFTVTNLGAYGVRQFTPILNPPQVGILGVGAIDYMVKNSKEGLLYYPAGTLSLTFDHRIIDGGPAARFLKKLCENLENIEEFI